MTKLLNHAFSLLVVLLLFVTASTTSSAQPNSLGTLSGRVTDSATKLALGGTRVSVVGTTITSYANQSGDYVLFDVPAGPQTIEFSYVGYSDVRQPVTVSPEGSTTLNHAFGGNVVTLEKIVITGNAVGTARAINQQRAADTLTNVVAADDIGRFPDQNAAESIQRIPGLAVYRDQGEGRFIVVRGIRPDLNSVQLNGATIASPDRGARTMPLDVLPSDALGSVEVTKVSTPDQESGGLGGNVNLKTRSPFDADGRLLQLSAQGQYNDLRDRLSGKYSGTYSDVFNDGKLGVIFSPTWQDRRFGSDNYEVSNPWVLRNIPGSSPVQQTFFNQDINYREYDITRTRYGANAAIEFKPDADSLYYIRTLYSHFADEENRFVTTIPFSEGTISALSSDSATVTEVRRENKQLRVRSKIQDLYAYSLGAEKTVNNWRFDVRAAYSQGDEERKSESVIFRKSTRGTNWSYSFAPGTYSPTVAQISGPSIDNPAVFNELNQLRSEPGTATEKEYNLGGNARSDFTVGGDLPAFVKFGTQARLKEKSQDRERTNYTAPSSFTFASLSEPQGTDEYPFFTGPRINATKFTNTFINNKGAFTGTRSVTDSLGDDWKTDEDVYAGYGMAGVTVDKLTVSSGARYEHTTVNASGNVLTTKGSTVTIKPGERSRDYDNVLPGAYLRYDLDKQTVLRTSYSTSLARPAFGDSALRRSVNDDTKIVTESNPGLKALTSDNYDASVERYFESLGTFSIAGFHKEIKNFTYQATLPGVTDPETGYGLNTFVNGPSGHISGLEFAWQHQLTFLPSPLDGFGLLFNYTLSDSSARYLRTATGTFEKTAFIGQSRSIGNVALSYEKYGFFARLALNFRSPRLREDEAIGASANDDRYVDSYNQFDFTTSYKLSNQIELFGEVLNLTNEPFRVALGKDRTRFVQFEEYGVSANFGVRWKL